MRKLIVMIVLLIAGKNIYGQQIINGMELRPRAIIDNGYTIPKTSDDKIMSYIMQRSRLFASFSNNKIETYISLQDVRFWGDNVANNTNKTATFGLDLAQGWFKLNINEQLSLKVGRQIYDYDDQRVLAARNWRDNQAANDAIIISYKHSQHKLDINLSWNTENKNSLLYPIANYRVFDFIHYQYIKDKLTVASMNILSAKNTNDSSTIMHKKATHGLFGIYDNGIISFQASMYYQFSLDNNSTKNRAFSYSANIWYSPVSIDKIKFGVGVHYLSGQDAANSDLDYKKTNHTFDILLGKRHGYYGYIDYFSITPKQGLQNYMLNLKYSPIKKLSFQTHYHLFWHAQNYFNPNSASIDPMDKFLGSELDLTIKWKLMEEATLIAGYSCYFTSNTLEALKNTQGKDIRFPQFAYLMITVKPQWKFKLDKN